MEARAMELKPDWPLISKRWEAFWKGEVPQGRILMSVYAPQEKPLYPAPVPPMNFERYHTDIDGFIARALYEVGKTQYWGDAYPSAWPSITGGVLGVLLGSQMVCLDHGVVWNQPIAQTLEELGELRFNRENQWFSVLDAQLDALMEHTDQFIVRVPDFHGVSDALVSLLGSENLVYSMMDEPELLAQKCEQIVCAWKEAYEWFYGKIEGRQKGTAVWFRMWHPKRMEAIQEDFADLLSTAQFCQTFARWDEIFAQSVDCAMFHLHNTMMRYQEVARNMKGIVGAQFRTPYDENRKPTPIHTQQAQFEKMHASGKKTWVVAQSEEELCSAIKLSDPRHLFVEMYAPCAKEAQRYLALAQIRTQERLKELGLS